MEFVNAPEPPYYEVIYTSQQNKNIENYNFL